jgi:Sulfotransferase family
MTQSPSLTVEAICAAAEARTGLDAYGSDSYRTLLDPLLYSLENESNLNDMGRIVLPAQVIAGLANRLTVVAWEEANPELAKAPIQPPLVILGLGRTGTTILQETLAAAPSNRTPLTWEITDYALVQDVTDPREDPRVQRIDRHIKRANEMAEGFSSIHFYDAYTPSECIGLTILDLSSEQFGAAAWMPTYREALLSVDHTSVYDWHRRGLRFLQAKTPGVQWVLKAPAHAIYLDPLLGTYPDAMIINPHRDPVEVVGSLCSLFATLRAAYADDIPVQEQAAGDADYAADVIQRAVDYRRAHPDVDKGICDVSFTDFMADQPGSLTRIYDHFGLEFAPADREAMLGYLANRPREKYGTHDYSLEQFGLTPQGVAARFADYSERFSQYF